MVGNYKIQKLPSRLMSAISTTSQSKVKKLPPEPVSDDEPVQPKKKKVVKNPEDCIKVYCRVRPPEANEESAKGIDVAMKAYPLSRENTPWSS